MKNMKKFLALGLATAMTMSMAACGGSSDNDGSADNSGNAGSATTNNNSGSAAGNDGHIDIGCWWVQYYCSGDTIDMAADWVAAQEAEGDSEEKKEEKAYNRNVAQLKFDNVKKIEDKYGVTFGFNNLTFAGVKESINTSILAGSPDCEVYMTQTDMAIPAQINGLAMDLKSFLPADHDIFTTQTVGSYLDLGDGKACIFYRNTAENQVANTYPLAFNVQLLEDNGLEDPRDLAARDEWNWDKFVEYCQVLTQDTDGDGQIDQYGYCGYELETLEQLMMSNGANIAQGNTETLSSSEMGEVLQMMYDMYNTYKVCYPYDFEGDPSNSMRNQYTQGNIGFFPGAAWIQSGNGDYDWDGSLGGPKLSWDTAYVQWPEGPSGDLSTNPGKNLTAGEFYIIPAGSKDPATAFGVIYDFWNWYDGDVSLRDDRKVLNWWFSVTGVKPEYQDANFEVMKDTGSRSTFDLWNVLGFGYDVQSLIKGETTPAQFQETYKQQVQDGLDAYFGN